MRTCVAVARQGNRSAESRRARRWWNQIQNRARELNNANPNMTLAGHPTGTSCCFSKSGGGDILNTHEAQHDTRQNAHDPAGPNQFLRSSIRQIGRHDSFLRGGLKCETIARPSTTISKRRRHSAYNCEALATTPFKLLRPCSNCPPTILSQSTNKLNAFAMKLFLPDMVQVTSV